MFLYQSKATLFITLLFTCFTPCIFAEEEHTQEPEVEQAKVEEKKDTPIYAIPPAKQQSGDEVYPFFLGISYTFWSPYVTGINIAYPVGNTTKAGNYVRPNTYGVSGFKVSTGTQTHHDYCNARFCYTWYNHHPAYSTKQLAPDLIYEDPFFELSVSSYYQIKSQYRIQFNRIDGMLDKEIFTGHYITYRPWLGLLGAWDTEHLNTDAKEADLPDVTSSARMRQYWWGVGPYAGIESRYFFTGNFGINIQAGTALLYAQHRLKSTNTTKLFGTSSQQVVNIQNFDFYNSEPMIETLLGVFWEESWKSCGLKINIAWELQTYFKHNGLARYYSPTGILGNYSMQGLTATLAFGF